MWSDRKWMCWTWIMKLKKREKKIEKHDGPVFFFLSLLYLSWNRDSRGNIARRWSQGGAVSAGPGHSDPTHRVGSRRVWRRGVERLLAWHLKHKTHRKGVVKRRGTARFFISESREPRKRHNSNSMSTDVSVKWTVFIIVWKEVFLSKSRFNQHGREEQLISRLLSSHSKGNQEKWVSSLRLFFKLTLHLFYFSNCISMKRKKGTYYIF